MKLEDLSGFNDFNKKLNFKFDSKKPNSQVLMLNSTLEWFIGLFEGDGTIITR